MPIVQISRIQHRRGKATDLPQLAAGELGWSVDTQRLFIGNGTVADGAPAVGNTEIITSGSSAFSAALNYVYKGYLGNSTPIVTGTSGDFTRTLQETLDDHVSVKAFGAVGDYDTAVSATDDTVAIQRAIDEIYCDTDKVDSDSRRVLFFPAGTYKITSALKIPPYAHLVGEGPDKTIIRNQGNNAVAVMMDSDKNLEGSITDANKRPTQIQIEGITFKNSVAYGGVSIDNATHVYFRSCKFQGSFASGGSDQANSKGITVRSSNALPCENIVFDTCQFTKFARLADLTEDLTNMRFVNCDFATGYYGALIGETMDGSTAGKTRLRGVQFMSSTWSDIGQQAIWVKKVTDSAIDGSGCRNIVSHGNWYGKDVANNFLGIGSVDEVPTIQFDSDENSSMLDFFERSDLRRSDGSSHMNPAPEIQGIGIQTKAIKQFTLVDNQSSAATINEFPALAGKGLKITYKIERGTLHRTGELIISASTNGVAFDDTYTESTADVGVTLSAVLDNKDSTAGNETVALQYTTTNTSGSPGAATIEYQTTIIA